MFQVGARPLRTFGDELSATINEKGMLDVDVVKGCTAGMRARPGTGCYGACYAAALYKFRGFDFATSVVRTARTPEHRRAIEDAVAKAPRGFIRIGTIGDPSHAWEETVTTVEWLSPFARPVIVTKHWLRATDEQFRRLAACHAVLNTSVSALDTDGELSYRLKEVRRFESCGGDSVARVVSCDFNRKHPDGARAGDVQDWLFRLRPVLDNPLRVSNSHPLVQSGVILTVRVKDLNAVRAVSLANPSTYLGHYSECPDICGIALVDTQHATVAPRRSEQLPLREER